MENYLILLLVAVFGFLFFLFNELEDECVRNTWVNHKSFLNKHLSWRNKWKLSSEGHLIPATQKHWYYFGVDPKYVERFYLSSTVLVWLTDGEHLFQFLKKRAVDAGFLVLGWQYMVAWIVGVMLFSFIKEAFIKKIH